jgi:hypothetical protein
MMLLHKWLASKTVWHRMTYQRLTPGTHAIQEVHFMLYTIAVVLLILWLLGLVTSYTMGGFVHILLVVAIVMVLVNAIRGRRAL